eukprot:1155816-Pelagomonas_calceolata.AAC.9
MQTPSVITIREGATVIASSKKILHCNTIVDLFADRVDFAKQDEFSRTELSYTINSNKLICRTLARLFAWSFHTMLGRVHPANSSLLSKRAVTSSLIVLGTMRAEAAHAAKPQKHTEKAKKILEV